MDMQSYRGASMDSDHYLVMSQLRYRLNKLFYMKTGQRVSRLKVDELKNLEISWKTTKIN